MDLAMIGLLIWFVASLVIFAGIFVGRKWPKIQDKMITGSIIAICFAGLLMVCHAVRAFMIVWKEVQ